MMQKIYNILDVESLVNTFLLNKQQSIINLHNIYFKEQNKISYRALVEGLFDELKTGCCSFINKNQNIEDEDFNFEEELNSYLFYIANDFCKKTATPPSKKIKEYLCPGCLFLNKQTMLDLSINLFCYECAQQLKMAEDFKWIKFFNTFKNHSKTGFKCADCERYIPTPLDNTTEVSCPYIDCCFVGDTSSLKKMLHPNSNVNIKMMAADDLQLTSDDVSIDSKLEIEEDFQFKIDTINEVIEQQINATHWNSFNFTVKYKTFVYHAFRNVLKKHPIDMVSYMLYNSRSGGFQHKIFQEFVSIVEENLPLPFKKDGKIHNITSLLDEKLGLFDGISKFEAIVNEKGIIKNNTQEVYIGGRKGSIVKPFYIGKLLNVVLADTKDPIMHLVTDYSFSRIKTEKVAPNTKVIVSHLRVYPHYQMGGMVYVNRIRKKIIDKSKILLNKNEV